MVGGLAVRGLSSGWDSNRARPLPGALMLPKFEWDRWGGAGSAALRAPGALGRGA